MTIFLQLAPPALPPPTDYAAWTGAVATIFAAGGTIAAAVFAFLAWSAQGKQVTLLSSQLNDSQKAAEEEREANTPDYDLCETVTLPHGRNLMVTTFWKDSRGQELQYLQSCTQTPGAVAQLHLPLFNRRRGAEPLQIEASSPSDIPNLIHPHPFRLVGAYNDTNITNEHREIVFIQLVVSGQQVNERQPVEIHLRIRLATGALVLKKFVYRLGTNHLEWIA